MDKSAGRTASTTRRKARKTGRVTLADVAAYAEVSTATVSRSLSTPDVVKPGMRVRVEKAIDALGYVPDGAARALATQRSFTIGVIVPTLDIASFATGVQSLQESLSMSGYTPLLALSNYESALEFSHAHSLVKHGADGLVLVGRDHDDRLIPLLERSGRAFVNIWTIDPDGDAPFVGFDNRAAMRRITDYVLDKGHRHIAMILGGAKHSNDRSKERQAGFQDALADYGLDAGVSEIVEMPYGISGGREAFNKLWNGAKRPSAIVCGSDLFALGVLMECQRLGIEVPGDLSVTGFDDLDMAAHFSPRLTTMRVPAAGMGRRAAEYLLSVLDGEPGDSQVELPCELIERETVSEIPVG